MNLGALTQKIGPLPAWAWGGIAAVGVWWFFLRGKPSAAGTPNAAAAAGSQLSSGYGLGYAQGLQAAGPPPAAAAAPATTQAPLWQFGPGFWQLGRGKYVWHLTPAGVAANPGYPSSQVYPSSSSDPTTQTIVGNNAWQWAAVPEGMTDVQYAQQLQAAGIGGGMGGPKSIGSRSAHLMHHAHPLVGARVPYQFHVRAVGGPMNHAREVHRVALQAGVHPARIMALNPTPTGYIRVA